MLPTSLEILDISGGYSVYGRDHHKFTGGIPPEWGAFTNLKQLNMARCGLDGAFGSTRSERFTFRVDVFPFLQDNCPRNSESL